MENNLTYFQRRASQEKAAGLHAADPRARQAHLEMAQEYKHLIRWLAAGERKLGRCTPPQAVAGLVAAGFETSTAGLGR